MAEFNKKQQYQRWILPAQPSPLYPLAYSFVLVNSIDELKTILKTPFTEISFDTETTGLDLDEAFLVGYSFCFDGKTAYYVPVDHAEYEVLSEITKEEYISLKEQGQTNIKESEKKYYIINQVIKPGLGSEAVFLFYKRILLCKNVFMFNARFDIKVFEKYGFVQNNVPYETRYEMLNDGIDMSKVNFLDVQVLVFLADTNVPYPSLKKSEEYFLGWRGASFEETLGDVENFYYLKPEEAYVYAATDALGTFLLAKELMPVYYESYEHTRYQNTFNNDVPYVSSYLDNKFLYPLMIMEEELVNIDVDKLKSYSEYYQNEIDRVEDEAFSICGQAFNMGSPKQKSEMFKLLGITTYNPDGSVAVNKRGELKSDKNSINNTLSKYSLTDNQRKFMQDILNYASLSKQKGTYTDNFIEMCSKSHYGNRLRFSYKTMVVPSGRLAAGGDKKNHYYADSNIQNITKPKIGDVFYIHKNSLKELGLDVSLYDNPRQEYNYNGENTYMILDWVFKETPWNIEYDEEHPNHFIIEGFKQHLNIRSVFCPDDDKYWVSCDFSAQELRLPALISKEPLWTETFASGGDLHKEMACYSTDTQVLTEDGWKYYYEFEDDTKIAQFNPYNNKVTFVEHGPVYIRDTDSYVTFKDSCTDLKVTPDHRILYYTRTKSPYVKQAIDIYDNMHGCSLLHDFKVDGKLSYENIKIPATSHSNEININIKDFVKLIGLLLTDGMTRDGYIVSAYQKDINEKHREYIDTFKEVNKNIGHIFKEEMHLDKGIECWTFSICHANFNKWLIDNFGGHLKKDKYLPKWFKNLPDYLLEDFIHCIFLGDGTKHYDRPNEKAFFITVGESKQMAEDLQYIYARLGYVARIKLCDNDNVYGLLVKPGGIKPISRLKMDYIELSEPEKVFCFAVPTSFLVVRRNNKITVCGNCRMWGKENYSKQKRKMAKKANFGILYGMTAKNFAEDFGMPLYEAEDLVRRYKETAPVLFNWVHQNEKSIIETGTGYTICGRPRRLGWYLNFNNHNDRGLYNFGIRSCTNTVIQGSGADVLKISFMNIYDMFFKSEYIRTNRKYIKFLNTVHDEINYQVSKDNIRHIVPKIISCMRLWLDDWEFPMQVGLDIGTRWGQTVAFDYDGRPYVKIDEQGHTEGEKRYRFYDYNEVNLQEGIRRKLVGKKRYVEDPNGDYVVNKHYLEIKGPAGDPYNPKDFYKEEVKEEVRPKIKEEATDDFDFTNYIDGQIGDE